MPYSKNGRWAGGDFPQKGDIVRCVSTAYTGVRRGDKRVVLDVDDGCILLWNEQSPHNKKSPYKASSFELVSRAAPYQQLVTQGEKKMAQYIHVAILTDGDGFSWSELAKQINSNVVDFDMMADTDGTVLKERLKARIEHNPDEVWIMLGGHTIASGKRRPAVDVNFRSL